MSKTIKRYSNGDKITVEEIANTIDHSLLRPDITVKELIEGCKIARENGCISVCVRPSDLPIVVKELKDSDVLVTTVAAFPHGVATTESKLFETKDAIEKGAVEVDVVMNYGRFLSEDYDYVEDELKQLAELAHSKNAKLKVIFENHYLTPEQIKKACQIAVSANVDFVKTSTGYAPSGSKVEDLKIMRKNITDTMEVKSAGGIRNLEQTLAVLSTGAVRIGTRGTEAILNEAKENAVDGYLIVSDHPVELSKEY